MLFGIDNGKTNITSKADRQSYFIKTFFRCMSSPTFNDGFSPNNIFNSKSQIGLLPNLAKVYSSKKASHKSF